MPRCTRPSGLARTVSPRRRPGARRPISEPEGTRRPVAKLAWSGSDLGAGDHAGRRARTPEWSRYSFRSTAMSILDDAIREHLELIRRRGATDSEVARLEDEAFGPPTRPDEADFPESEEADAASASGLGAEPALDDPSPEEEAAHEDVTTLMPAPPTGEQVSDDEEADRVAHEEPGTGLEEPTGAHIAGEPESEDMLIEPEEEPVAEAEHEEPVAEEHAIVEEPAPEEHEEHSEEEAAAPEEATSLYDQPREEPNTDWDLPGPDEEPPADSPSEEHPAAEPEGATPL